MTRPVKSKISEAPVTEKQSGHSVPHSAASDSAASDSAASESKHTPETASSNNGSSVSGSKTEGQASPKLTKEYGGQKGPEPTRYGDWEKNGRCTDF